MAPAPVVLPGERYGRLVVVCLETQRRRRYRVYRCRCRCGALTSVTSSDLRDARVTSCGCRRGSEPGNAGGARFPA